jgi:diguanylate cyclase (GGDEF)-like protein
MHSHTLLITATILMFIVTTVLASTWHFNRHIPGLGNWALTYLSGFALCVVLLSNQYLPTASQVVATQLLSFLVAYLNVAGARAYVGRRPLGTAHVITAALVLVAFCLHFTLTHPHPGIRFAATSFATGILFLLGARTLAVGALRTYPARYLFALASTLHGSFLLVRPLLFAPGSRGLFDANHALAISEFVVLESIVALILLAFGALMLANEHSTSELRRLAERDSLTGVFNRRCFIDLLGKALSRGQRSGLPSAVLLLDLDHFKSINDTLGHKGGDEALRHFVHTALASLRNEDVIGRVGGEEFAILLSGAGRAEALATAERVRAAVAARRLQMEKDVSIQLTVSVGVAISRRNDTIESVLDRADQAMYAAKHNGRNRVETLEADETLQLVTRAA